MKGHSIYSYTVNASGKPMARKKVCSIVAIVPPKKTPTVVCEGCLYDSCSQFDHQGKGGCLSTSE